jgi:hypothetical protein|tara:strand:- start:2743 stop:3798 length:1056 start_codon:yes stop_codon:yes gene_type:complete
MNEKRGRIVRPMVAISIADNYDEAKHEWRVTGNVWDYAPVHVSNHPNQCLCGHKIRWHFEIENTENGILEIVGSDCVENWMVYRHLTENKKIDPATVTEEKIKEWMETMVMELKATAWQAKHGEHFNEMFTAIADIDLRVNTNVKKSKYDIQTARYEPVYTLRKKGSGSHGQSYKMASIVWRWNHPDNPKSQSIKYGFPTDKLWADLVLFYAMWQNKLDYLEKENAERLKRITRVKDQRERASISSEIRVDVDESAFEESCEFYGIEPFEPSSGKNGWERNFLRDIKKRMLRSQELSEKQYQALTKILFGNNNPASAKQISYLESLQVDIPDNLTVKEASELINEAKNNDN